MIKDIKIIIITNPITNIIDNPAINNCVKKTNINKIHVEYPNF